MLKYPGLLGEHAYVALLHGFKSEFLIYALQLGHRLAQFDASTPRVLLLGKDVPDQISPFMYNEDRQCLDAFWQVVEVDLVDQEAADRTRLKRHRYVFTKLRAFQVPFRKIIFFDLDIVIRSSPKELFQVQAPAGMYHGYWNRSLAGHGGEIPTEAFHEDSGRGCINAGLMRLDPLPTLKERNRFVEEMLAEVAQIDERDESYLPEQYYLVNKIPGWRHITVSWNCEVNPLQYMDTRGRGLRTAQEEMPKDWLQLGKNKDELLRNVKMFHFSGKWVEPWWFLNTFFHEAVAFARKQFEHSDPRGMIALAVAEWLSAVSELEKSEIFNSEQMRNNLYYHLDYLSDKAEKWWTDLAVTCCKCGVKNEYYWCTDYCEECEVAEELLKIQHQQTASEDTPSTSARQSSDTTDATPCTVISPLECDPWRMDKFDARLQ